MLWRRSESECKGQRRVYRLSRSVSMSRSWVCVPPPSAWLKGQSSVKGSWVWGGGAWGFGLGRSLPMELARLDSNSFISLEPLSSLQANVCPAKVVQA